MSDWRGRSIIGVDVGAGAIKALQAQGGNAWKSLVLARAHADDAIERDIERLGEALWRRGFAGREVVLAAPASWVRSAMLELPPRSSGAPLDQIVRSELSRVHRVEPSTMEVAWWEIPAGARAGGSADTLSAMAVASAGAQVERLVRAFEASDFDVARVDVQPWAMLRAVAAAGLASTTVTVMLDLGWSAARLSLVHGAEGRGVIAYERELPEAGAARFVSEVERRTGLPADIIRAELFSRATLGPRERSEALRREASASAADLAQGLAEEAAVSLAYAAHRYPMLTSGGAIAGARVVLAGAGAMLPHVAQALAEKIPGVEVSTMSPAQAAPGAGDDPRLVGALGLALAPAMPTPKERAA
jgi:Tfp pilus assembly PilM family ATPase